MIKGDNTMDITDYKIIEILQEEGRISMKDLGKTIAKYRKEHKLNQSQLAKELEAFGIKLA